MKSVQKIIVITVVLLLSSALSTVAQSTEKDVPIDASLTLKNMHLWRGLQITNEAMAAVDLSLTDKSQNFRVGLWGGAGFSGKFREFDYYVSYQNKGFKFEVWDICNFSTNAEYQNTGLLNYNARETMHFIDVTAGYTFQGKFPLSLSWSTVVFGRDRGMQKERNLYSTYVAASYPVLRDRYVDLDVGVAGAFALDPEEGTSANFFAKHAGIVNVNLTVSKKLHLGSYTLPVSVMGMWNPANSDGNLQIALELIRF